MHVASIAPRSHRALPLQHAPPSSAECTDSMTRGPPATAWGAAAPDIPAAYARLRRREQQALPGCGDDSLAEAIDALTLHDAQVDLALDYERLAGQALARGDWTVAVQALERWWALAPPRATALEAWRMTMATARMGKGSPDEASALLREMSPHPMDVRSAWSAMARDFEAWGMATLADAARVRGCRVSLHDVARALQDREAAEAFVHSPDLKPGQREAFARLIEAFEP